MERRAFLAGTGAVLLAAPLVAEGQQAGKVYRIGVLSDELPVSTIMHFREPFQKALRNLGYVEGQNIVIEDRSSEGRQDRLSGLAADLVRLKVEVMVTIGAPASRAAMNATKMIPIVFARVADPVGSGLVSSLGRPGGNTTGVTVVTTQLAAKRLELLKEAFPGGGPVHIPLPASKRRPTLCRSTRPRLARATARRPRRTGAKSRRRRRRPAARGGRR
jgi:putative tryptophan/tyrosine transport system substrate-binding protein